MAGKGVEPENGAEEDSGCAGAAVAGRSMEVTEAGMRVCVAAGADSVLCRGPEDHPPDEGPNGEMEGVADSEGAAVVRA